MKKKQKNNSSSKYFSMGNSYYSGNIFLLLIHIMLQCLHFQKQHTFFLKTLLVSSAATGGVITKIELFLFNAFLVSSFNIPLPIWILTPFSLKKRNCRFYFFFLLLVVGAIPASLTAVCIIAIPFVSIGDFFFFY